MDFAISAAMELGGRLKEALDFCLSLESARRLSLKRILNDCGDRLVTHQHFSLVHDVRISITNRTSKYKITHHYSRQHAPLYLCRIFSAMRV